MQSATTTIEGEYSFPQLYIDSFIFVSGMALLYLGSKFYYTMVKHLN